METGLLLTLLNKTTSLSVNQKTGIEVVSCTFNDLINTFQKAIPNTNIKGQLCIPEYQRPYVWKEKQINRLLDDFIEYYKNTDNDKPLFYLGSIIVHKDEGTLKIIDGQQRITTLLLINSIINKEIKSGIQYTSTTSINNIKRNFSYLKSVHAKDVFDYADTEVLNYIDFDKINVTLVVTATEDLAYTFFETQNTGGVRLSGSDIIKAHHLRAISSEKNINYQARKWEGIESEKIESIIQNLTKIRFWDNRNWRRFPFYRDEKGIKEVLIEEFTENTKHDKEDISFYYSAVKMEAGRAFQMHESNYKQLKQPLSDGNNTLDYINDYVHLHDVLFNRSKKDYRVSDAFYDFNEKLMHGNSGTLFLKELLEICIITYVSRFGFYRLFEASLWLYRSIYSLRVSSSRNVREDSIFKFVFENQFIDNIIEVYTVDELILYLKRFKYTFNTDNLGVKESKDKHIGSLNNYFNEFGKTEDFKKTPKAFDKAFLTAIVTKIKENNEQ
ncbi:DUF262 domain-containing protein [Cytophaga hutchinsonii]|uniref:Uncharacterized protein n=1 Tax=Cytophaga hutchinsonii (strain ATCC 33406 / DSM 1761 / CIP 103989 / NBRC 15051 / NCIMB 9469 / D465) TaxID=269798 RepID=A0A6N4SUJ6_CYTH3|nr:DUF262 domain-containing protein [Cytophaga hutchinsonii]ABG60180.1 conserved hypothetical protein [Cytophaga hutchinsonii ATCC 33406]SFX22534.1 Protein of unknown function DUF262 [Cytophaga hutchinsonii ATCC 33406]